MFRDEGQPNLGHTEELSSGQFRETLKEAFELEFEGSIGMNMWPK